MNYKTGILLAGFCLLPQIGYCDNHIETKQIIATAPVKAVVSQTLVDATPKPLSNQSSKTEDKHKTSYTANDFKEASSYDVLLKVLSNTVNEDYHLMNLKTNGISQVSATTEHAYPSNIVNIVTTNDGNRFEEQKAIISHYMTGFLGGIKFSQPNTDSCKEIKKTGTSLFNAIPGSSLNSECDPLTQDGRIHVTTNLAYHYISGIRERDSDASPVNGKVLKYQLPDESRITLQEDFPVPLSGGIELYNGTTQDGVIHIYMIIVPHN